MDKKTMRRTDKEEYHTVKKTRVRKRGFIVLGIIAFISILILYIILSYRSGLNIAAENGVETTGEEFNPVDNHDGKKTMMIIGKDRMDEGAERTDVIMIGQYDYMQKEMKLVSVMRDIYVEIPGYQSYKINAVYSLGGVELLREVMAHNFDINIEEYVTVDYDAFMETVNVINPDGITIDVEKDMSEKIDTELKQGVQQLNGKDLLAYARFRNDEEGDFGRVRRQQQVLSAIQDEVISIGGIVKMPKIIGTGMGYVDTSMSNKEMYRMIMSFMIRGDKDIATMTLPLENTYQFMDTSHTGNVIDMDFEANNAALKEFLNSSGKDTNESEAEKTAE
ncbi:LytR family transcriptional regulator [Jeotgalicoccus coquinae]|uniref:Regulatory protein MsrR n=1 Tax=Jeotgalicoccus coquinae TaxID=709509 RepID=A0A6V7R7R4_9STAP|nr:LCP family protein [Jeotgalicoccus coquinae]MBB6423045.1 LCP family protein required for cell wall assembly [Jeotgalicoccus coquinae]GGE11120.1 LytR family transcriptional regulator [Jeotgalicoccus coquinae]CAD2073489.1 Regulatory protein MsrR [Jeotgalicoccus coquinae]